MSDTKPMIDMLHRMNNATGERWFAYRDALIADIERQAEELAAANEARGKAERERDVLRNCQFHNESELRKADAEICALRTEIAPLRKFHDAVLPMVQEILDDHRDKDSSYYNECEDAPQFKPPSTR